MKIATLCYDTRISEGVIKWSKSIDLTQPDVVMLDTLQDCLNELEAAYEALHAIVFPKGDK
jgi:hypothetical protein